ncbi:hypothetical protein [Flammeovirga agarivorans]|uniref:Uncharacterized protein n=1 Tax=Flammeovirga agarivorans TaxID=2726742 RepID=A0A7X8XZ97_9BACT|nr:hypothetical protein [Flammeovirga agarivorans]NLR94952.1 hypothetical protein [Flammeovirga agarivorans]
MLKEKYISIFAIIISIIAPITTGYLGYSRALAVMKTEIEDIQADVLDLKAQDSLIRLEIKEAENSLEQKKADKTVVAMLVTQLNRIETKIDNLK